MLIKSPPEANDPSIYSCLSLSLSIFLLAIPRFFTNYHQLVRKSAIFVNSLCERRERNCELNYHYKLFRDTSVSPENSSRPLCDAGGKWMYECKAERGTHLQPYCAFPVLTFPFILSPPFFFFLFSFFFAPIRFVQCLSLWYSVCNASRWRIGRVKSSRQIDLASLA